MARPRRDRHRRVPVRGEERPRLVARVALGVLFLVFGALVNVIHLVTDWNSFADFGEMSQFAFVRDSWASRPAGAIRSVRT